MRKICFLFIICGFICAKGQYFPPDNLVLNPDFSEYTLYQVPNSWDACIWPDNINACGYLNENTNLWHLFCVEHWKNPTHATPDYNYHDSCNYWGFPYPFLNQTGFCNLAVYSEFPDTYATNHEYAQGVLKEELIENNKYCVSMFVLFNNYFFKGTIHYGSIIYFTSSLGVFFSSNKISRNDKQAFFEHYPPQIQNPLDRFLTDSVNWMLVSGSFVAEGGEKFITIGNFLPDTMTPAYQFMPNNTGFVGESAYLVGFVGVYDCTGHDYTCNAGEDMRICNGQVVQLGTDDPPAADKRQYRWSPALGLSDSTAAKPLASPTETTTYTLYVIDEFLQESYDTVTVEVIYCDIFIPNIFSPNGDGQNDVLYVRGQGIEQLSFVVYNRWGQKVFETKDPNHGWDGTINGKPAETGVYVYHVTAVLHDGLVVSRYGDVALVR